MCPLAFTKPSFSIQQPSGLDLKRGFGEGNSVGLVGVCVCVWPLASTKPFFDPPAFWVGKKREFGASNSVGVVGVCGLPLASTKPSS